MKHLTLPSFSLGQVSWAATSLEDHLLEKGGNESWSPWMWWMRWNVLQQRLGEEKGYEGANLSALLIISFLFPGSCFLCSFSWNWKYVIHGGKRRQRAVGLHPLGHLQEGNRSQPQKEIKPPSYMWCIYLNCFSEKSIRVCNNTRGGRGKKMRKRKELTHHHYHPQCQKYC